MDDDGPVEHDVAKVVALIVVGPLVVIGFFVLPGWVVILGLLVVLFGALYWRSGERDEPAA